MNKRIGIGIAIILLAVVAVVGILSFANKKGGSSLVSTGTSKSDTSGYTFAKPEPLSITGAGGCSLGTVDLGEGPVPLIQIPLDTWGGYAGLFAANGGVKPNKNSLFYQKGKFAVELVNVESAQEQLNGYAAGRWPIIWAPMDSLPLLREAVKSDKRITPKVIGLFDWSAGGDGIIVRNYIKKPIDLKDKIVLTSSNSPYSFLLLWYLSQIGLTGNDVKVVWVDDGDKALEMFKNDKNIAAWVSWTPYINDVVNQSSSSYIPDTRLLITSKDTNQLIADTFITRNDLLQEKPEIMKAFVEAIIEGSQKVDNTTYTTMASFYKLKDANEAKAMMGDVHLANFPETKMFFDESNPIGAFKVFFLAEEYYKQIGVIPSDSNGNPEQVISSGLIAKIDASGIFKNQKNMIADSFNKKAAFDISDLENQRVILANDIKLYFEAQKLDFDVNSTDPNIKSNMKQLSEVAQQTKVLATSIIKLTGHLDTAKVEEIKSQGQQKFIEASAQAKLLSKKRAEYIKKVLIEVYKVDADRIITEGKGWNEPMEGAKPEDNRRVEVQFISLE